MSKSLYRYNTETCQYERIGTYSRDIFLYASGVLLVALAMLAGMLILHDYMIDSEKEIALRAENKALVKNQVVLTAQLNTIQSSLSELQEEDQRVHTKFFGTPIEKTSEKRPGVLNREVLLADAKSFRKALKKVNHQTSILLDQTARINYFYANRASLSNEKMSFVTAMPTLPPVQPWKDGKLLSGFGMRVNPFHKGLYKHPGVDIAMPRGSDVIASSAGTVTVLKRSFLQAGYGNYIEVDHGYGFVTRYAHLEEIKVKYGQHVKKGAVIGTIGSSGGSIAPHLHYEIIRDGRPVDPVLYIIEGLNSAEYSKLQMISEKQNQSLD